METSATARGEGRLSSEFEDPLVIGYDLNGTEASRSRIRFAV